MTNKRIIQFMTKLLDESGLNVTKNPNYTKKWRYILSAMLFIIGESSVVIQAFLNYSNLGKFIQSLGWVSAGMNAVTKSLVTLYLGQTLGDVLHSLDESNEFVYPDEYLFNVRYSWYLDEEIIMRVLHFGIHGQVLIMLFVCSPAFIDLMVFGKLRFLIYPGYIPWQRDDLTSCWLALLYQLPVPVAGVWLVFILMIFPIVVLCEFLKQFEKLRYAVCTLEHRTVVALQKRYDGGSVYETMYDDVMRENIISCFKHHRMLRKNFQLFSIWFAAIFSCELIPSTTAFACGFLGALIDGNYGIIFIQFNVGVLFSVSLLAYCFIGEIFSGLNESIADAMFYEWVMVKMNKRNRRLAFIFHMMVDRPFEIFGCFIFKACLNTFARIVRNIFSWFNVINATFKKKSI